MLATPVGHRQHRHHHRRHRHRRRHRRIQQQARLVSPRIRRRRWSAETADSRTSDPIAPIGQTTDTQIMFLSNISACVSLSICLLFELVPVFAALIDRFVDKQSFIYDNGNCRT